MKINDVINHIKNQDVVYYGVLKLTDYLDLLIGIAMNDKGIIKGVIYRGFPLVHKDKGRITFYIVETELKDILNAFPEIEDIEFNEHDWPEPYENIEPFIEQKEMEL